MTGKSLRKIILIQVKGLDICPAFISKQKFDREQQIIFFFFFNGGGWHYLAVKKLSTILGGITWRYSISAVWTFDDIENKHYVYRCEDCMKKICESLGEQ